MFARAARGTLGRRLVILVAIAPLAIAAQSLVAPSTTAGDPCPAGYTCGEIQVDPVGLGAGTVVGEGINCQTDGNSITGTCRTHYQYQTPTKVVELTVTAAQYSTYLDSTAHTNSAGVPVKEHVLLPLDNTTIFWEVRFNLGWQEIQFEFKGAGSGVINHSDEGVVCPPACTMAYMYGETGVIVIAVADADSVFKSWDGICAGEGPGCQFDMPKSQTLTVTFGLKPTPTATSRPPTSGPATPKPTVVPTPAPTQAPTAGAATPSTEPAATATTPESPAATATAIGSPSATGSATTAAPSAAPIDPVAADAGFGSGLLVGVLAAGVVIGLAAFVLWRRRAAGA